MDTAAQLRDRLRKIEALFARAGTPGERLAAEAALARVRARLAEAEPRDSLIEMQSTITDPWSRRLFVALCRRYGLEPYRRRGQKRTTIMVKAPRRFLEDVFWPQFHEINAELQDYLRQLTEELIQEAVWSDTSDVREMRDSVSRRNARRAAA